MSYVGPHILLNGGEIFKHAVRMMEDAVNTLLRKRSRRQDVNIMIPHQANIRILGSNLRDRLGIAEEKVFINLSKYGNTSAASIPIAP